MTDLTKTILQKSSGEHRIHPDEQRRYMGTFRERVVLAIPFSDAEEAEFQEKFTTICEHYLVEYQPLTLKISPKLTDRLQIVYLKTAQEKGMVASIIDEKMADSPFALLLHTNHAVDVENIELSAHFATTTGDKTVEKIPFWKKLFR